MCLSELESEPIKPSSTIEGEYIVDDKTLALLYNESKRKANSMMIDSPFKKDLEDSDEEEFQPKVN